MTDEQLIEWGTKEDAQRKADLATLDSQDAMARIQRAAKARRNAAGLSAGQAVTAVRLAQQVAKYGKVVNR